MANGISASTFGLQRVVSVRKATMAAESNDAGDRVSRQRPGDEAVDRGIGASMPSTRGSTPMPQDPGASTSLLGLQRGASLTKSRVLIEEYVDGSSPHPDDDEQRRQAIDTDVGVKQGVRSGEKGKMSTSAREMPSSASVTETVVGSTMAHGIDVSTFGLQRAASVRKAAMPVEGDDSRDRVSQQQPKDQASDHEIGAGTPAERSSCIAAQSTGASTLGLQRATSISKTVVGMRATVPKSGGLHEKH